MYPIDVLAWQTCVGSPLRQLRQPRQARVALPHQARAAPQPEQFGCELHRRPSRLLLHVYSCLDSWEIPVHKSKPHETLAF